MIKIALKYIYKLNIVIYIFFSDFNCGNGTRKGINDWKKQAKKK